MISKMKGSRSAVAIALVLALAGTVPAWAQSQVGNGLSAAEDPYSGYYSSPYPSQDPFLIRRDR